MFHRGGQVQTTRSITRPLCGIAVIAIASCRLGEHVAEPPIDGRGGGGVDGGEPVDGDPPDAAAARGLHAMIGERPEWTGSCDALDDRAEMVGRFEPPTRAMDVTAGWEFDTTADDYGDPSYGFDPRWAGSESGRFSLRLRGRIGLVAGVHCFSVDIGATGTDIIGGRNACGQVWIGAGSTALAETGFGAASVAAATGCVELTEGTHDLDIVFWYFNVLERAKLRVRRCAGQGCVPDLPIRAVDVIPR
jgi:hypothetical protein